MDDLLTVSGVSVNFGGIQALRDVSLEVKGGEILGLIGPNGAGKTTLFEVITGFEKTHTGVVSFDGRRISDLQPHRINRLGIGRTFQIMQLFPGMTALDNVITGGLVHTKSIEEATDRATWALGLVGLKDKSHAMADTLSTGQRKRVEVARALATGAKLMLFDEIFGGLDAVTAEEISSVVEEVRAAGRTVVLIDHNLEIVLGLVDRLIVLDLGEVIAEGDPHAVSANPRVIKAYIG